MLTWAGVKHAATLVLWVPLYSAVQTYAYSLHVVDGLSMQPTFNPAGGLARDWVVVERWGVRVFTAKEGRGGYTRGDVVLLRCALPLHRVRQTLRSCGEAKPGCAARLTAGGSSVEVLVSGAHREDVRKGSIRHAVWKVSAQKQPWCSRVCNRCL